MKHKLNALIQRIRENYRRHPRRWQVGGAIAAILVIGLVIFFISRASNDGIDRTSPNVTVDEVEAPTTVASPLTGVQVSPEDAARPVTAIVIENSPDARPQSSLHKAGIVFEAIAEGGITRYLAFYQESKPDPVGPVRSLRPYFNDWILAFDASIAHVGGSAAALQEAIDLDLKDLDEFANANAYYRTTDRYAPHNLYTNFGLLDSLNKSLGYTNSEFESWPRKNDEPIDTPRAKTITVNVSSLPYQSSYTYDKPSNSYLRTIGGQPDIDRESGTRIAPKVVIVIEAENRVIANGRYEYDLVGKGKATIFQDGRAIVGNWNKAARDAQFSFTNDNGDVIELNAGQVWVTAISPSQEVEFSAQ